VRPASLQQWRWGRRHQTSRSPAPWGTDQPEPVPGQTTGDPRVPRQRLWCDLNGERRGSGSRLPEIS
jgi:hypothetical protein